MSLPEKGTKVPSSGVDSGGILDLSNAIANAIRDELRGRRSQVKIVARWTGASERAVKKWLAGETIPNGQHLVALMSHSELVTWVVLAAAGRVKPPS
ncbi:conserved protein of unknown function [Magnetospirillum sp. XM-1]|uniref:XRE family transcriptional regulator n=1 Tax=Magnetospirillum sp. XM-1 TaxID=1663591 RepID=UPI00073DE903|nr:XRE family transcriptional regulator [Magnetospirillum sp. XM-1]CUW37168.1 conserved protein of unknown function [Magnetospirillum sp. XM-1]